MSKTAPKFRTGSEEAKEASTSRSFHRTEFFSIDDGESIIVRFLTDADPDPDYPHVDSWITVDQHGFIPTRGKPSDWPEGRNWPSTMSAVCRDDDAFAGMFDDCYICDHMKNKKGEDYNPTPRVWALAVEREEVFDDDGERLGIRDKEVEVETDDGKRMAKVVLIVNQAYSNFFTHLQGYAGRFGTILDRDFYIKREGGGTDTKYHFVHEDPLWAEDEEGNDIVFDLRNPEHMARYEQDAPDLGEVVLSRANDEFYALFFDERMEQPSRQSDDGDSGGGAKAEKKPEHDVDEDEMKALAQRVKGYGGNGEEAEADDESEDKAEPKKAKKGKKAKKATAL